jgi:DNA-binding beta-propeller fold protein YncE
MNTRISPLRRALHSFVVGSAVLALAACSTGQSPIPATPAGPGALAAPGSSSIVHPDSGRASFIYTTSYVGQQAHLISIPATSNGVATPVTDVFGNKTAMIYPDWIYIRPSDQHVWLANFQGANVERFGTLETGNVFPQRQIGGSHTGIVGPYGVTMDHNSDNMYVSCGTAILVFASGVYGNNPPTRTITGSNTGLKGSTGMWVDSTGTKLYVADSISNAIYVFDGQIGGNVAPTATIQGSNTGLNQPFDVKLDSAGHIYVTNSNWNNGSGAPSIEEFAANSNGDVTPVRTIAGANTTLIHPYQLAVDHAGNIYTTDAFSGIKVFGSHSQGNVAPTQSITLSGFTTYAGIAVR